MVEYWKAKADEETDRRVDGQANGRTEKRRFGETEWTKWMKKTALNHVPLLAEHHFSAHYTVYTQRIQTMYKSIA